MKTNPTLYHFRTSSIAAAVITALCISQPVNAGDSYWRDSAGDLIRAASGDCVKTGDWLDTVATAECDQALAAKLRAEQELSEAARLSKGRAEAQARAEAEKQRRLAEEKRRAEEARKPVKVTLNASGSALFAHNSSNLTPTAKAELNRLAERIKDYEQLDTIRVTGHTDSAGSAQYNKWLSERRAERVKSHLVSKGLAAEKISTAGKGETQPVNGNATRAERAKNRRVEIEIRGQRTEMRS
jgi:OOP family OmpA-OmpF porin